ncbi:aminotransferase class I/II-fold pyridoxal phosphate-dependent enzyme [Roseobacter cerasinus]|uniref:aminotransferase class I/II-fold pyridoxal phosphate-dependent enzyme n=1 Tax=Roseobacter cerasinus TaxID=2602289 RepID=UPI001EEA293E|nr:aminotransferase class I/II-fold pyridoxal phosphate-dependent enzyme [Roseobacter cerasinus]
MTQIDHHILPAATNLRRVLSALERVSTKICLIVDADGRILRTVTDGDVRRALLGGHNLDSLVSVLGERQPVTRPHGTSRTELLSVLDERAIDAIVLVDSEGKPVDLADRTTLTKTLLLSPPHIGKTEAGYVQLAFDENWVAPAGPNLNAFEDALCRVSGRQHAVALVSGTAGLHLALRVLDIGEGDRVYVSDLTFAASVQPILYVGAEPVFIDSEPESWNMSPAALERALEQDKRAGRLPKAVIVVHLYGQSANMNALLKLTEAYGVPVIEDAAESLGANYGNRPSGAHGLMSVYSFNGNKIITTSGGGALVSDRPDLVERARKLATQGRDNAEHYQHSDLSYNYRMSNVLAGIGRGQLEVLSDRVAARRAIFERYVDGLSKIPGVGFQMEVEGSIGNRWLTVISLDPDEIALHPYQLMRSLKARGIETRPAWKPMQMQPLFSDIQFEPHMPDRAVSPGLFLTSLCLPSGSAMSVSEQEGVIEAVTDILASGGQS